jgi:hypothetical protein
MTVVFLSERCEVIEQEYMAEVETVDEERGDFFFITFSFFYMS